MGEKISHLRELGADFSTFIPPRAQVMATYHTSSIPTQRPNMRLKLPGAPVEELRCLVGEPFFLPLHCLAPTGIAPAA